MFLKKRVLALMLVFCLIATMLAGLTQSVNAALDLPSGCIYDAVVLQNGNLAALYTDGGNVNYGVFDLSTGKWSQLILGAGKEAALDLDILGNPHVAYIDASDNLVYKYYNGLEWSAGETIDSITFGGIDGALSYPDIKIDGSGKAHIVYYDAKGGYEGTNDYGPYELPDLVYATNTGGSFVKTVRSYSQGWFYSPDGWRNWAMAPAKIEVAGAGYYIGVKQYGYSKWMGGQDHTYNYSLLLPPAEPSNDLCYSINSSSTNNDLGFTLYDMGSYGPNVYSLYKKSGNISILNGVSDMPSTTKAFAATAADLLVDGTTGALYYAAISSSSLLLYQNGAFKEGLTLPAAINDIHTRIATVVAGNIQYILYTDNTGKIRVHGVSSNPDSAAPAWMDSLPTAGNATINSVALGGGINEPGTIYYIVVDRDATAPSSTEVKAGANYGAVIKKASGSFTVMGYVPDSTTVTGLSSAAAYDVYFAAQDNEGNLQGNPVKLQFATSSLLQNANIVFADSDADRVYFDGDTLSFNMAGLDALNGQALRVSFGVVGQSGIFEPTAVINGLTVLQDGVQQFVTTSVSNGAFSTNISGTILQNLKSGVLAIQLYRDADGPGPGNTWINVLSGQPTTYIALSAESKPAIVGIALPESITSMPVLGHGAQITENLYNIDIAFQKVITEGVSGKIAFTGLDLISNRDQLAQLSGGLTFQQAAVPAPGCLEQFTLGVDVATLTFLANKGATISATSPAFDGHASEEFTAVSDAIDGIASNLSFDDSTDTVTFTVNHFSNYTLSMINSKDSNGDGYYDADVAAIVAFLEQPSDAVGKKNGEVLRDVGYNPLDPSTFIHVTWNTDSPKRVTAINWDQTYGYDVSCMAGSFDVRALTELTSLKIVSTDGLHYHPNGNNNTAITAINVTGLNKLTTLDIHGNRLTAIDLTGCTALQTLDVSENALTVLNAANCTALTYLNCGYNAIQSLNVSPLTGLTTLWCYGNQISALDVSALTSLTSLDCQTNNLTTLDISNNNLLQTLYCGENNLGTLDVSGKAYLTDLDCWDSNLTSLNVTGCISLNTLYCVDNNISSLDLSGINTLQYLYCENNNLTFSDLPVTLPVAGGKNYSYAPQKTVPITLTAGGTVDLSGEKLIDGEATVFTWYKAADNSAISDGIVENNGVFTFNRTTLADTSVYCVMSNAKFADFTGANALKTSQVLIQAIPVYTITFNSNGGNQVDGQSVQANQMVSIPAVPTKQGWVFTGWYSDESLTSEFNFATPVTGNINLYAKWEPEVTDAQKVAAEKQALTWDSIKGANASQDSVTANLSLNTTGAAFGCSISWESNDTSALSVTGQVYRPSYSAGNKTVRLTATITSGQESDTVIYDLTVVKQPQTDAEAVAQDKEALAIGYAAGDSAASVTQNLQLVTTGANGSTITWQSSNTEVISNEGIVLRPAILNGDENVSVTATIYKNGVQESKLFTLTVLELPASSNADLSGLTASGITFTPAFSSSVTSYNASVGNDAATTTISVTADHTATVKINNTETSSKIINLVVGSNPISIEVTAQNGTTQKTYTLNITRASSSTNGDSGNGNIGGGNTGTDTKPEIIVTTTNLESGKTTLTSTIIEANTNAASGIAAVKVGTDVVASLLEKAKETEKSGQKSIVELKVDTAANVASVKVEIPGQDFDKVAAAANTEIKVNADIGTITFNKKAVETINSTGNGGDISIGISKVDAETLSSSIQERIGDRPVYDFSVKAGETQVSSFGGGSATISIPYTAKPGENKNAIVVYYIDDSGKLKTVRGKYDESTNTVTIVTAHFSKYAVGYNEVEFEDVQEGAWYRDAVAFMAAREIISGIGNGKFDPEGKLTRGQFIVMVMKAYGIDPDTDIADNFGDAGDTYYTGYIAAAKRLGITGGIGNNLFAPEREITRQEMFTLLYKVLKELGELPQTTNGKKISSFTDSGSISEYAKEAISALVEAGIITGSNGKLAPEATTTRAQMVQTLYNLLAK